MELAIALALAALGVVALVAGWKVWQKLMARAEELSAEEPSTVPVAGEGPAGPDGLVCLFSHEFVRPARKPGGRDRAFAPLTEDELDPEDFALQMLYALLAELFMDGRIDFRIAEREPPYTGPFPTKSWELQVEQLEDLPPSPLANAMTVAFEMILGRRKRRRRQDNWVAIDDLIDRMLRAIRQELSFWERTGVYGDLRTYVENALVAQGYLLPPERSTWLDRVRQKRRRPNVPAIEKLADEARRLRERLVEFRRRYGSTEAVEGVEVEGPLPIGNVDPKIIDAKTAIGELPLDDCLRASLYEVLTELKQLEPSSDSGV